MNDDTPHGVVSALDQLEEQQQLFVLEYMKDLHQTNAAIRANYSEKTAAQQASRLLSNVKIQNAIAELKAQRNERLNIDADYVIKTIVETIERCSQAKQVYDKSGELVMTETPNGDLAPAYKYDASNVLKGAELLGRHLGMFEPKVDEDSDTPTPVKVVIEVKDGRKPESNDTSS